MSVINRYLDEDQYDTFIFQKRFDDNYFGRSVSDGDNGGDADAESESDDTDAEDEDFGLFTLLLSFTLLLIVCIRSRVRTTSAGNRHPITCPIEERTPTYGWS